MVYKALSRLAPGHLNDCLPSIPLSLPRVTLAVLPFRTLRELVSISSLLHPLFPDTLPDQPLNPANCLLHLTSSKELARTTLSKVVSLSPQTCVIFPDSILYIYLSNLFTNLCPAHRTTILGISRKVVNIC